MPGVFIAHLPSQTEQVASLVDLLETSLTLEDGAVVCTSLPGYGLSSASANADDFRAVLDSASIVMGIVDQRSLVDPQLLFELGAAWSLGKWMVLVTDREGYEAALPWQLRGVTVVCRGDQAGLVSMIEDIAFQLDTSPRISREAQEAISMLSTAPPQSGTEESSRIPTVRPPPREKEVPPPVVHAVPEPVFEAQPAFVPEPEPEPDYESYDSVRPAAPGSVDDSGGFDLTDQDLVSLEPLDADHQETPSCSLSLEAGRAISECAYHREQHHDLGGELEQPFGRFIDSVGGNWSELRKLNDLDVWMGATDNLLETLPPDRKHVSDWYELGFQLTTLLNIAGEGLPNEPEQRAVYEEAWMQAIEQFRSSATEARIRHDDVDQMQALLYNLIGPEEQRDYTNISRSIDTLRHYAAYADGYQ